MIASSGGLRLVKRLGKFAFEPLLAIQAIAACGYRCFAPFARQTQVRILKHPQTPRTNPLLYGIQRDLGMLCNVVDCGVRMVLQECFCLGKTFEFFGAARRAQRPLLALEYFLALFALRDVHFIHPLL